MESAIALHIADQEANLFVWRPRRKLNTIPLSQFEVQPCSLPKRSQEARSTSSARINSVRRRYRPPVRNECRPYPRHTESHLLWAGTFLVEPGAKTGIHHHGEQDTVIFVLEGEAIVRWGDLGEHRAAVKGGDFLHVPAWLLHQELNSSETTPFRWVVVRSTPEPIVVNLSDDFWGH
jgi:gentisate 1,2-dioxygenase